jgi:uncharacterized protein
VETLAVRIGLISDTHGLLREEALRALKGSELIIHAGDIGKPEILDALRRIAPVAAVRGNVDTEDWAGELPVTEIVAAPGVTLYVLHNLQELDLDPRSAGFHIVVTGHTHKPQRTERSGVFYINPGSAGPLRFDLPVTLALLDLTSHPRNVEFIDLLTGKPAEIAHRNSQ